MFVILHHRPWDWPSLLPLRTHWPPQLPSLGPRLASAEQ